MEEGGAVPGKGCGCPPTPPLFIGGGKRGPAPLDPIYGWGRRPRGEECLPSQVEASPFRVFPLPCPWALGGWCPWPIKARAPPYSPCYYMGRGGTISGPLDPSEILRNLLEASRYNTEKTRTFPEPEQQLSIYKSLPPDHCGTPRDIRDLIRDSEQHSVITYKSSL